MAKTKQTRRMIAMALAASVATSAMPVTAFAETVGTKDVEQFPYSYQVLLKELKKTKKYVSN